MARQRTTPPRRRPPPPGGAGRPATIDACAAGLGAMLNRIVARREATAAVGRVLCGDTVLWQGAAGRESFRPTIAATPATRFDLASITKPFVATLGLALDVDGTLPLRTRLGDFCEGVASALAPRTIGSLLRHRSGLQPWAPLALLGKPIDVPALLLAGRLDGAPPGTYSDLGYILFDLLAARAAGEPLDALLASRVLRPLGLRATSWSPGARPGVAASVLDGSRERELAAAQGLLLPPRRAPARGRVQDGNARFLGGVAGHAGLFASAADVGALAREWMAPGRLLEPTAVEAALRGRPRPPGWSPRRVSGSAGPALGQRAFGHLGFTGGSVWADPERELVAVLLAHRVDATVDLAPVRREFHGIAAALAALAR